MNARMILNNTVLSKLRKNPGLIYYQNPGGSATVQLGHISWEGAPARNLRDAKDYAAAAALADLEPRNEDEIRELCGLPPRNRVSELDHIRDTLKVIKRRVKDSWITTYNKKKVMRKMGDFYVAVDTLERVMRQNGVSDSPY